MLPSYRAVHHHALSRTASRLYFPSRRSIHDIPGPLEAGKRLAKRRHGTFYRFTTQNDAWPVPPPGISFPPQYNAPEKDPEEEKRKVQVQLDALLKKLTETMGGEGSKDGWREGDGARAIDEMPERYQSVPRPRRYLAARTSPISYPTTQQKDTLDTLGTLPHMDATVARTAPSAALAVTDTAPIESAIRRLTRNMTSSSEVSTKPIRRLGMMSVESVHIVAEPKAAATKRENLLKPPETAHLVEEELDIRLPDDMAPVTIQDKHLAAGSPVHKTQDTPQDLHQQYKRYNSVSWKSRLETLAAFRILPERLSDIAEFQSMVTGMDAELDSVGEHNSTTSQPLVRLFGDLRVNGSYVKATAIRKNISPGQEVALKHQAAQHILGIALSALTSTRHFQKYFCRLSDNSKRRSTRESFEHSYGVIDAAYSEIFAQVASHRLLDSQLLLYLQHLDDETLCRLMLRIFMPVNQTRMLPGFRVEQKLAALIFECHLSEHGGKTAPSAEWANLVVAMARATTSIEPLVREKLLEQAIRHCYEKVRFLRGKNEAMSFLLRLGRMRLADREIQLTWLLPLMLEDREKLQAQLSIDGQSLSAIEWLARTFDRLNEPVSRSHASQMKLRKVFMERRWTSPTAPKGRTHGVLSSRARSRLSMALARLASDAAQDSNASDRAAFKLCTRLYYFFQLFGLAHKSAASKALARTMVWSGIVRPLVCGRGLSSDVAAFIIDVVRKLEGSEVAAEVDRIAVAWQSLAKQQQQTMGMMFGPDGEQRSADASHFKIVPYHTVMGLMHWMTGSKEWDMVDLRENPFMDIKSDELIMTRFERYKERAEWFENDKARFLRTYTLNLSM